MVTTTIQITHGTRDLLNKLKVSFGTTTYDEVIRKLASKKTGSMAGKLAKGKKYTVKEILHNLRDEGDRY
jgi:predicted CopG family antitoxin